MVTNAGVETRMTSMEKLTMIPLVHDPVQVILAEHVVDLGHWMSTPLGPWVNILLP